MRETSLEDFFDGSEDAETASEDAADDGGEPADGTVDDDVDRAAGVNGEESENGESPDRIEPTPTTYAWTATGADCTACGSTVERRVRDGDRLVCFDCKVW